MKTLLYTSISR